MDSVSDSATEERKELIQLVHEYDNEVLKVGADRSDCNHRLCVVTRYPPIRTGKGSTKKTGPRIK